MIGVGRREVVFSRLKPESLARKLLKMVCGFSSGRVAKIQATGSGVTLFDGPAELVLMRLVLRPHLPHYLGGYLC